MRRGGLLDGKREFVRSDVVFLLVTQTGAFSIDERRELFLVLSGDGFALFSMFLLRHSLATLFLSLQFKRETLILIFLAVSLQVFFLNCGQEFATVFTVWI